jgi:hypothetical protein
MPAYKEFKIERYDAEDNLIDENDVRQWEADSGVIRNNVKDIMNTDKTVARVVVIEKDTAKTVISFERDEDGKALEVETE